MLIFITIIFLTSVIAPYVILFLYEGGFVNIEEIIVKENNISKILAIRTSLLSIVIGTIFISLATKIVVKPINALSSAAKKVASGDFQIAVEKYGKDDEVSILIDNFNLMVTQLAKNENLHKDFVSNLSHEYKTPISSIAGYAEMLKQEELSKEKRLEYAQIIINQTNRLTKLSANLLKLSELENKSITIQKSTFSLDEQIRDAILLLQNNWEEKKLKLVIELDEIKYTGDKELLYQVWINLIENAIKFTKDYGEIKVRLYKEEGIHIEIIDNGIGIQKEELSKIFDRFYKIDVSRSTKGTGLGLSIVKNIIEIHRGSIQVNSQENSGTQFMIIL